MVGIELKFYAIETSSKYSDKTVAYLYNLPLLPLHTNITIVVALWTLCFRIQYTECTRKVTRVNSLKLVEDATSKYLK